MTLKKIQFIFFIFSGLINAQNTNIALGKPTLADSEYDATYTSNKANDGNNTSNNSRWLSASTSWPHWIEIDLQGNYEINQFKFWTGSAGGYSYSVQFEFQIWNGVSWITVFDGSSNNLSIIDVNLVGVTTSKVRLNGVGAGGGEYNAGNIFRLYELEVYGVPESSPFPGNDISYNNGNIGIGTADTKGFKLGVHGKIAAEEVKVALYSNWADFVFEEEYKLPTLQEVEHQIKEKGHLKDIPSAEDVKENGILLGEMNSKLLQKIEELTLYAIQQQKEIDSLRSIVEKVLLEFNSK